MSFERPLWDGACAYQHRSVYLYASELRRRLSFFTRWIGPRDISPANEVLALQHCRARNVLLCTY